MVTFAHTVPSDAPQTDAEQQVTYPGTLLHFLPSVPQLAGSLLSETQLLPLATYPASQETLQIPWTHVAVPCTGTEQTAKPAPHAVGSELVSAHRPLAAVQPGSHWRPQYPVVQMGSPCGSPGQITGGFPHVSGSVLESVTESKCPASSYLKTVSPRSSVPLSGVRTDR